MNIMARRRKNLNNEEPIQSNGIGVEVNMQEGVVVEEQEKQPEKQSKDSAVILETSNVNIVNKDQFEKEIAECKNKLFELSDSKIKTINKIIDKRRMPKRLNSVRISTFVGNRPLHSRIRGIGTPKKHNGGINMSFHMDGNGRF